MRWPDGFACAGVHAGIKASGAPDLGLLVSAEPAAWAGTFTRNAAAAAPVTWCRGLIGGPVRAVVVNSGNANACTGEDGEEAVATTAAAAGRVLGCSPEEILVCSTGPIGVPLPVDRLTAALPDAGAALSGEVGAFAGSILTTDKTTKISEARAGDARVLGVAKGAAMLAPGMATMLAFIATDAQVARAALQEELGGAVESSFNRISVDACESTNDTVLALAGGRAGAVEAGAMRVALTSVCRDLAEQMARDAEGGSRLVRIRIAGAPDESAAVALGKAVAASTLWRAAVHGADPNWGRIIAALGSADRSLDTAGLSVALGEEVVFSSGAPSGSVEGARRAMDADEITVACSVGSGEGEAEILTSDLSPTYVALNAFAST